MPANPNIILEANLKDFISKRFIEMEKNVKGSVDRMKKKSDELGSSQNKLKGSTSGLGKGIKTFATRFGPAGLAVAGLTLAMVKLGQGMKFVAEKTEGFEQTMSTVNAIVTRNASEMSMLSLKAKELGENTAFSAQESGQAFVELGKLGFKTNEIISASGAVLNIASASMTDMATASITTARTIKQFDLDASDATKVTDIMAKSFTSSALDMDKFTEAMKFVGPVANNLGTSLETTAGAMAELADKGISGSMAGTSMRRIMLELGDANGKVANLIGKTAFKTSTFQQKLDLLQKKNLTPTQIKDTFGLLASTSAGILIKGADNVDKFTTSLQNSQGAAKSMAEIMLDNVAGATTLNESAQEGLAIAIGEAFGVDKQKRIEFFTSLIQKATAMVKRNKNELETIGRVLSNVMRVGAVVGGGLISVFSGVISLAIAPFNLALAGISGTLVLLMKGAQKLGRVLGKEVFNPETIEAAQETTNAFFDDFKNNMKNVGHGFTFQAFADDAKMAAEKTVEVWEKSTDKITRTTSELTDEQKKENAKRLEAGRKVLNELELLNLSGQARQLEKLRQFEIEKRQILTDAGLATDALDEQVRIRREELNAKKLETERVLQEEVLGIHAEFSDVKKTKEEKEFDTFKKNLMKKNAFLRKNKQKELNETKLLADKKIEIDDRVEQNKRLAILGTLSTTLSSLSQALGGSKKFAVLGKGIAMGEAVVSGRLAVQKALASTAPPLNFLLAGAVGVATGANIAKIASQKFETGGFPQGRNASVIMNERGQESVLNARATSNLGVGGVNALNSGQQPNTSVTNQISYSPILNVSGNGSTAEAIIEALSQDKEGFARFMQEEVTDKGYN